MNSILIACRKFYNCGEEDVSRGIEVSLEDYKNLELGVRKIEGDVATRLSQFFKVPPLIFHSFMSNPDLSINYTQCNFYDSNGYVNHLYKESEVVINAKNEIIALLKEEVYQLRNENKQLLTKLLDI
jgi:hypothetical protein